MFRVWLENILFCFLINRHSCIMGSNKIQDPYKDVLDNKFQHIFMRIKRSFTKFLYILYIIYKGFIEYHLSIIFYIDIQICVYRYIYIHMCIPLYYIYTYI